VHFATVMVNYVYDFMVVNFSDRHDMIHIIHIMHSDSDGELYV